MSSFAMPQRRPRKQFDRRTIPMVAVEDATADTPTPDPAVPVPAPRDLSRARRPLEPLPLFRPDGHGMARETVPEAMWGVAQAQMSVKHIGGGAAWTATHATGLPHSSRGVTEGDVVQMMRQKLEAPEGEYTRAGILAHMATIEAQIAEIEPDETALGFIDMKEIARLRGEYDTNVKALQQRLQQDGHDDAFAMSRQDIIKHDTPLGQCFYAAIFSMRQMRMALNASFEGYRAHVAEQKQQAAFMAEQSAAMEEISSFNQQKKLAGKIAQGEKEKGPTAAPAATAAKVVVFPHKGKHCPPPKAVNDAKLLERETAGKGKVALYITNDAETVVGWERKATAEGLKLHDNFTAVHRFDELIGADQGEMTHCIRIDGGDHGHPIVASGSPTSFDTYVKTEIEHYRAKNDAAKLREIAEYLTGVGLDPRTYKLQPTG